MPTKEERQAEAKRHIGMMRGLFATDIAKTIETAKLYEDGEGRELELPEPRFESTNVSVERVDAAKAVTDAKGRACVLDFASYRYPGGGYVNGGWSQEEELCSQSSLYPVLDGLQDEFYIPNRQTRRGELYTDRALYLSDVVFTTGGAMKKRDVLVCSPVNRRFALQNHRSEPECDIDMVHRVHTVMHIAAANEVDSLVLGAFGCGLFGNDPTKVAILFRDWLAAHPGQFQNVVFAIPGGPNLDAFREVFPVERKHDEVAPAQKDTYDDFDDDDWRNDLSEDNGRWVFE